jgi:hypothetical protein
MNDEHKRHIAGAIRNNMTHHSPFEPILGHRFVWREGHLYRLTDDGGQIPVMPLDDIYGLDDNALSARAMGEALPVAAEPETTQEDEPADEEEASNLDEVANVPDEPMAEQPKMRRSRVRKEQAG